MLKVQQAAISARLPANRTGLLAGLPAAFVASLPHAATPGEQMLVDLDTMNAAGVLTDGTVPLASWLMNAMVLAASRQEVAVFERALDQVLAYRIAASRIAITPPAPKPPRKTSLLYRMIA